LKEREDNNCSRNVISNHKKENRQLKVFELYFVKSLTYHFIKIFDILICKEEMFLSQIKFKNMYVVDLSTNNILFDMVSIRVKNLFIFRERRKIKRYIKMKNYGKKYCIIRIA
jgi:hypothetical protein